LSGLGSLEKEEARHEADERRIAEAYRARAGFTT